MSSRESDNAIKIMIVRITGFFLLIPRSTMIVKILEIMPVVLKDHTVLWYLTSGARIGLGAWLTYYTENHWDVPRKDHVLPHICLLTKVGMNPCSVYTMPLHLKDSWRGCVCLNFWQNFANRKGIHPLITWVLVKIFRKSWQNWAVNWNQMTIFSRVMEKQLKN